MYYYAHSKRIYVIGGEGLISVFQQKNPDHYELTGNIPSSIGARTGFYFPTHDTDRLYVAVPSHVGQNAEIWVHEVQD